MAPEVLQHGHRVDIGQIIKQPRASDEIRLFEQRFRLLQTRQPKEILAMHTQLIARKQRSQPTLGVGERLGVEIQQRNFESCSLVR